MSELEHENSGRDKGKTKEEKSSEDTRLHIAELINGKDRLSSEIWDEIFKSPENVRAYLEKKDILDKNWKNSGWLYENEYRSLYSQAVISKKDNIKSRFKSWEAFLIWMGEEVEEKTNWDEVFKSRESVNAYLEKNDLLDKNWKSSQWLYENGYRGLYSQALIFKKNHLKPRFESWDAFLVWMEVKQYEELKRNADWNEIFKSQKNVRTYLRENNILDKKWTSPSWLNGNGYCAFYQQAVVRITEDRMKPRFESWDEFLVWMEAKKNEEIKRKENWNEIFKSQDCVRLYLVGKEIFDQNWKSSEWLQKNGYGAFYQQVVKGRSKESPGLRFASWEAFLIWMGVEIKKKINWDEVFRSPENVRVYLEENNLLDENWQSPSYLRDNGYNSFYQQVVKTITQERLNPRFKSWNDFLIWMGEEVEEKRNWDEVFRSPENVRVYLEENDLLDKDWKNTSWLNANGHSGFYQQAVSCTTQERLNPRFKSWEDFLIWMGERESANEENFKISEEILNKIREGIEDEF